MSLIEQLGYEYAKEIYLSNLEDFSGNASGATISTEELRFTHEELEKALLEYRRQHNIFEIGDKVVEITDYPSNDVLTVKSISHKLLVCESDDFNASYVLSNKYKPYFYVRRATDEEIKAGKRLEVV
ncbi:hypothetical protein KTH02_11705 [Acinetobacter radioresistens]|uniref:hypothetical protein n=1 Tax=Acinetobacter radioresistens TaxID=40216 RepID=UPI0021CD1A3B|nr:hypothetical protein [Acinetobacter radioresistens]MCU4309530.1 hypothetical protein [Acinetobacter radioresistens]